MKINRKLAGLVAALALAIPAIAWSSGNWSTLPIVGSPSFCASTVTGTGGLGGITGQGQGSTGSICAQTVPAGPAALTGLELIPADTGLSGGAPPQTVDIPVSLLGGATNRIIGGDATTNLNQRSNTTKGIAALANVSPTAAIISADRWWIVAPAAALTYTVDSTASTAVVPGLNNTKAFRLARTSSGAAGVACFGQTLDTAAAAPLFGNNAVFSFYEKNGAGQSATNGNIVVNIDYTSVADHAATQGTLGYTGTNSALFAQLDTGGTITGLTNGTQAVTGFSPGTTGTLTAGLTNGFSATIAASTTWTRYAVYASIPVNVPNTTTPVSEVSVSICFTPVATTAITTDYIELEGMQLEAKPSTASVNLPNGVISPTAFERRFPVMEQLLQYYYLYFNYESQTLVSFVPNTTCTTTTSTTAGVCTLSFPVPMRVAPAMAFTNGFQLFTSTAYTTLGAAAGLATYTNTLTTVPSNTSTMFIATASTLPAVGTQNFLMTLGTSSATGIISASAEP